jgi:hypothetical protein
MSVELADIHFYSSLCPAIFLFNSRVTIEEALV